VGNEKSAPDALSGFINELSSNFKELSDMAQVLGQDCTDLYVETQRNNGSMYRRAYVRSVFAFIEGITYRMKRTAAHFSRLTDTLQLAELILIDERNFDIDDKGEVVARPAFIKFKNNVKFSFKVYSKSVGSSFELSLGGGWQKLLNAVKVRDRLMHPKASSDLEVSDDEVEAANIAFKWFFISYALCGYHAQKGARVKTSPTPEAVAALDEQIKNLEAELKNIGN
jgi:hypothetical protein